jgi:hypothetical protein
MAHSPDELAAAVRETARARLPVDPSSLITARVNREYLNGSMQFTCIEPYPRGFLVTGVAGITDLMVQKVEDVPLSRFDSLGANDVLFIDSSHTVRTGGDVVWLFGQVLPRLRSGVHVHIHDVFLPGDYPEPWVREGWGWNENYLKRIAQRLDVMTRG